MARELHHPWRVFRGLTEWTLRVAPLPEGVAGLTCWRSRTVTVAPGLLQAQRRSTIAHEVEHVLRGPTLRGEWWQAREEAAVERAAARKLIGLDALADALAWAHSLAEAAEELWVDEALLRCRLGHLHPAERAWLGRRLPQPLVEVPGVEIWKLAADEGEQVKELDPGLQAQAQAGEENQDEQP